MNDVNAAAKKPGPHPTPAEQLDHTLGEAETLLTYAATEGIALPGHVIEPIVEARMASRQRPLTRAEALRFFTARTLLSSLLKPVTAATIEACEASDDVLKRDRKHAIRWTVVALFISGLAFIQSSFTTQINDDIDAANKLAVALRAGITSPEQQLAQDPCLKTSIPGSQAPAIQDIGNIQQFASLSREIYWRARKYNLFIFGLEYDPFDDAKRRQLELNPTVVNYQAEVFCKIGLYEDSRYFGKNVVLDNSYLWGALSQYALPVLYALVGAYAARLRSFADTVRKRTYHPSFADNARLISACILGAVVSLFNLSSQAVSLPPLGLAFLAGYAVEVFFALIDSIVKTFSRSEQPAAPSLGAAQILAGHSGAESPFSERAKAVDARPRTPLQMGASAMVAAESDARAAAEAMAQLESLSEHHPSGQLENVAGAARRKTAPLDGKLTDARARYAEALSPSASDADVVALVKSIVGTQVEIAAIATETTALLAKARRVTRDARSGREVEPVHADEIAPEHDHGAMGHVEGQAVQEVQRDPQQVGEQRFQNVLMTD